MAAVSRAAAADGWWRVGILLRRLLLPLPPLPALPPPLLLQLLLPPVPLVLQLLHLVGIVIASTRLRADLATAPACS